MIKGIYSSGAGLEPRMMQMEVISNNLANIDNTGFKRDNLFIKILKDKGVQMAQGKGELSGLEAKEFTDFSEGSLKPTGNQLDAAIWATASLRCRLLGAFGTHETATSCYRSTEHS